jgi:hypothetical protein
MGPVVRAKDQRTLNDLAGHGFPRGYWIL